MCIQYLYMLHVYSKDANIMTYAYGTSNKEDYLKIFPYHLLQLLSWKVTLSQIRGCKFPALCDNRLPQFLTPCVIFQTLRGALIAKMYLYDCVFTRVCYIPRPAKRWLTAGTVISPHNPLMIWSKYVLILMLNVRDFSTWNSYYPVFRWYIKLQSYCILLPVCNFS